MSSRGHRGSTLGFSRAEGRFRGGFQASLLQGTFGRTTGTPSQANDTGSNQMSSNSLSISNSSNNIVTQQVGDHTEADGLRWMALMLELQCLQ